jgi:hypothetical protein
MPTPEVIDRARELHDQLEKEPPDALDPVLDVRPQLAKVLEEPHNAANYDALSERLQAAYEKLEVDHPTLAAFVQATINALNAAGL